jgi:hypothetical protein
MIDHAMIVSFGQPLPGNELDQFLLDIERATLDTRLAQSVVTGATYRSPAKSPFRR